MGCLVGVAEPDYGSGLSHSARIATWPVIWTGMTRVRWFVFLFTTHSALRPVRSTIAIRDFSFVGLRGADPQTERQDL